MLCFHNLSCRWHGTVSVSAHPFTVCHIFSFYISCCIRLLNMPVGCIVTWRNHRGTLHLKERYITTASLRKEKRGAPFDCAPKICSLSSHLRPIFVLFHSCQKGTAMFRCYRDRRRCYRHISLLRENYRHISQYREPPKSVPPYFITARKLPPYFSVPGTAKIGTAKI